MKATIRERVPGRKLHHLVPPAYRDEVRKAARPDGCYTLLLFAHAARDVVPSPPVRKALRRTREPVPDGVLAVGTVFTVEALELLREAGARVVACRKATWTDESARQRPLEPGPPGSAPPGEAGQEQPGRTAPGTTPGEDAAAEEATPAAAAAPARVGTDLTGPGPG